MRTHQTLLLLEALNPLKNVEITRIQNIEKVGDSIKITWLDDAGNKQVANAKATDFLMNQIVGYNLEYSEV